MAKEISVEFQDLAFKRRTIVLPDGRCFPVEASKIVATDQALIDFLSKSQEFKRVEGSAAGAVSTQVAVAEA